MDATSRQLRGSPYCFDTINAAVAWLSCLCHGALGNNANLSNAGRPSLMTLGPAWNLGPQTGDLPVTDGADLLDIQEGCAGRPWDRASRRNAL